MAVGVVVAGLLLFRVLCDKANDLHLLCKELVGIEEHDELGAEEKGRFLVGCRW